MKKYIYGLIDTRTSTLGDLCLLDRDEVFHDGLIDLLSDSHLPDYLVSDLVGYCFGSVTIHDDDSNPAPIFDILDVPKVIISGASVELQNSRRMRKEAVSRAEQISENS